MALDACTGSWYTGNVTLNITANQNAVPTPDPGPGDDELLTQVVAELGAWRAGERSGQFQEWKRHSISLIHLHLLSVLQAQGALPMGHLADALHVSVASATGIVTRMEERHLVQRRGDPGDRRIVLVDLTDAGRQTVEELDARRLEHLRGVLETLHRDELRAVLAGVRALRAAVARGRPEPSAR